MTSYSLSMKTAPAHSDLDRAADLFKVLGDPTRLQILQMIGDNQQQELCSADICAALNISAPTVSHHIKKLLGEGLIIRNKRGKWAYFEVMPTKYRKVSQFIHSL